MLPVDACARSVRLWRVPSAPLPNCSGWVNLARSQLARFFWLLNVIDSRPGRCGQVSAITRLTSDPRSCPAAGGVLLCCVGEPFSPRSGGVQVFRWFRNERTFIHPRAAVIFSALLKALEHFGFPNLRFPSPLCSPHYETYTKRYTRGTTR
jgi:hypothetical protein